MRKNKLQSRTSW